MAEPRCGEPGYERCPECQAHRSERHLPGCTTLGGSPVDQQVSCSRMGCDNTADLVLTVGRGDKARVRFYCEPCAAECRTIFGKDVTSERVIA